DRFDGNQSPPGEIEVGALAPKGARDRAPDPAAGSVDHDNFVDQHSRAHWPPRYAARISNCTSFDPVHAMLFRIPHSSAHTLVALDELDDVAVRVLDHGDTHARQDLRLGHRELHTSFFERIAHATEIANHETQAADAELLLQTDGACRRDLLGV